MAAQFEDEATPVCDERMRVLYNAAVILTSFRLFVILRSEATKDLLSLISESRSFASLRMTGKGRSG
jgi:hypothetical protein